jgi:hypothetical protein
MSDTQYLNVYSMFPPIIIRVPLKGGPGKYKLDLKWRDLLRALTPVMQSHGGKQKDITSIDNLSHPDEAVPDRFNNSAKIIQAAKDLRAQLELAYDGDVSILPDFWLYDWKDGSFVLVRKGTKDVGKN